MVLFKIRLTSQLRHGHGHHQMSQENGARDRTQEDRQETIHEIAKYEKKAEKVNRRRGGDAFREKQLFIFRFFFETALLTA